MMRKKLVSIGLAGTLAAGMLSGSALAASTEGASETASTGERLPRRTHPQIFMWSGRLISRILQRQAVLSIWMMI